MDKLYKFSISEKKYQIVIFWLVIVIINSLPWFIWWWTFDILWRILWILTWLLVYVLFISQLFKRIENKVLKCAIYNSYKIKTFLIIFIIWFYLDLYLWIISISLSEDLMNLLDYKVYSPDTLMWQTEYKVLFSYLTTIIHWWLLNVLIWIFSLFLFWIFNLLIKFWSIRKEYYSKY